VRRAIVAKLQIHAKGAQELGKRRKRVGLGNVPYREECDYEPERIFCREANLAATAKHDRSASWSFLCQVRHRSCLPLDILDDFEGLLGDGNHILATERVLAEEL
jgi:hypothetical protein